MAIINIGLLGPGKIAKRVADGIISADNANLYAIGSRNINRAREFAKDYHAIAYENEELLKDSYKRYLENVIRKEFGFDNCPIRLLIRAKREDNIGRK